MQLYTDWEAEIHNLWVFTMGKLSSEEGQVQRAPLIV